MLRTAAAVLLVAAHAYGVSPLPCRSGDTGCSLRVSVPWQSDLIAVSPNGKWVAQVSGSPAELRVWDSETGSEVQVAPPGPTAATAVAFSADGRSLAVLAPFLVVYNVDDAWQEKTHFRWNGVNLDGSSLAFANSKEEWAAPHVALGRDGGVLVYDHVEKYIPMDEVSVGSGQFAHTVFSDEETMITASAGTAAVFAGVPWEPHVVGRATFTEVAHVAAFPDGRFFVHDKATRNVTILTRGASAVAAFAAGDLAALSPDGTVYVSGEAATGRMEVRSTTDGSLLAIYSHTTDTLQTVRFLSRNALLSCGSAAENDCIVWGLPNVFPPVSTPTAAPDTDAPATNAPDTNAPDTDAPDTAAPKTSTPATPPTTPATPPATAQKPVLDAVKAVATAATGKLASWQGDNFCVWGGVSCNAQGSVTALALDGAALDGEVPDLSGLADLQYLYVQETGITGFAKLPASLVEVDFSYAPVYGPFPAAVAELPNLRTVRAKDAGLTGPLPVFSPSVQHIDVHNNEMTGPVVLPPSILNFLGMGNGFEGALPASATVLRIIVNNNKLTGTLPAYPSLLMGHFHFNNLEGLYVPAVQTPKAWYVDLSHNSFAGPLPNFAGTPMHVFKGHHNAFTGGFHLAAPGQRVMGRLSVNDNNLTGPEPTAAQAAAVAAIVKLYGNSWGAAMP